MSNTLQVLLFLNRHEDALRQSEIFLPLAPTAVQPYLIRFHSSHVTRHTSHVTHHTSHITHHTSHITPFASRSRPLCHPLPPVSRARDVPYRRGVALHFLERHLEAITCLVIGLHIWTLADETPSCRAQLELYLGKSKAALALLQASGAAPINEADLSAPPEIEMKGEKAVKKEVAAAPSHISAAIAGSFDEDADARGFMRPSDGGGGAADAGQAAEQLQICLDGIDPSDSSLKQFLQQSLTLAAAASAVKKFTVALSIYSQILEVVPKQVDALRGIAKIHECSPHL